MERNMRGLVLKRSVCFTLAMNAGMVCAGAKASDIEGKRNESASRPIAWSGADLRRVLTQYFSTPWVEHRGQNFDPRQYVRDLKAAGAGTIEFMMKDHHGDAKFKT